MPQARPVSIAPSQSPRLKNLVMLYSLYLCGYEGVKFEIMHSLHNPLSAMQEIGSPAKSEPTSPSAPRRLGKRGNRLLARRSGLCMNTSHPDSPPSEF